MVVALDLVVAVGAATSTERGSAVPVAGHCRVDLTVGKAFIIRTYAIKGWSRLTSSSRHGYADDSSEYNGELHFDDVV